MSGIERYFRDYGYLHERLGNALSYLKDPREFFWKQKAKKEAAVLIQDPELAALQREAKEFFPEGQLYAKYTDFERYFAINLRRIYRLGLPSFLPSFLPSLSKAARIAKPCAFHGDRLWNGYLSEGKSRGISLKRLCGDFPASLGRSESLRPFCALEKCAGGSAHYPQKHSSA